MATILLVWKFGAGTGHAMHAAPHLNGLGRGTRLRDARISGGAARVPW